MGFEPTTLKWLSILSKYCSTNLANNEFKYNETVWNCKKMYQLKNRVEASVSDDLTFRIPKNLLLWPTNLWC